MRELKSLGARLLGMRLSGVGMFAAAALAMSAATPVQAVVTYSLVSFDFGETVFFQLRSDDYLTLGVYPGHVFDECYVREDSCDSVRFWDNPSGIIPGLGEGLGVEVRYDREDIIPLFFRGAAIDRNGSWTTRIAGLDFGLLIEGMPGPPIVPPPPGPPPVPEPAAWALMIGGFGLVGASFRLRARGCRARRGRALTC